MAVKIRIIQKLFVFLLLTVGIVFMLQLVQRRLTEPFISSDTMISNCRGYLYSNPPGCSKKQIGADTIFVCEDGAMTGEEYASDFLKDCADSLQEKIDPSNVPVLRETDTACYKVSNSRTATNFYVCYQRPPITTYDDNGDSVYLQPFEDDTPYELSSQIPDACSAYQTTVSMIYRSFSTNTVNKGVIDNAISVMTGAYDTLKGLSTTKCAQPAGGTARNTQQTNACSVLTNFTAPYREGPTGTFSTLYGFQTTIGNALSNLQATYTNTIKPSFGGICPAPSIPAPPGFQT